MGSSFGPSVRDTRHASPPDFKPERWSFQNSTDPQPPIKDNLIRSASLCVSQRQQNRSASRVTHSIDTTMKRRVAFSGGKLFWRRLDPVHAQTPRPCASPIPCKQELELPASTPFDVQGGDRIQLIRERDPPPPWELGFFQPDLPIEPQNLVRLYEDKADVRIYRDVLLWIRNLEIYLDSNPTIPVETISDRLKGCAREWYELCYKFKRSDVGTIDRLIPSLWHQYILPKEKISDEMSKYHLNIIDKADVKRALARSGEIEDYIETYLCLGQHDSWGVAFSLAKAYFKLPAPMRECMQQLSTNDRLSIKSLFWCAAIKMVPRMENEDSSICSMEKLLAMQSNPIIAQAALLSGDGGGNALRPSQPERGSTSPPLAKHPSSSALMTTHSSSQLDTLRSLCSFDVSKIGLPEEPAATMRVTVWLDGYGLDGKSGLAHQGERCEGQAQPWRICEAGGVNHECLLEPENLQC